MQIKHATTSQAKIKNVYKIELETYRGDADGDSNITLTVKPDKIKQVVAEIIFIQSQFNGRGGLREMYDQTNYFGIREDDWDSSGDHDGYWEWFDREFGDYPYDCDHEQNNSLRSYKIYWYDENGSKFACTVHDTKELQADIAELNLKHHIDDYNVWDNGEDSSELYPAYRAAAIEVLKKHTA